MLWRLKEESTRPLGGKHMVLIFSVYSASLGQNAHATSAFLILLINLFCTKKLPITDHLGIITDVYLAMAI